MKNEKIICQIALWILIAIGCTFLCLAFKDFPDIQEHHLYLALTAALLIGAVSLWEDNIKEREDPLNLKRTKEAINYAEHQQCGTAEEFIDKFNIQMYKHLLNKGIIHQIKDERIPEKKWEITQYGINKNNYC